MKIQLSWNYNLHSLSNQNFNSWLDIISQRVKKFLLFFSYVYMSKVIWRKNLVKNVIGNVTLDIKGWHVVNFWTRVHVYEYECFRFHYYLCDHLHETNISFTVFNIKYPLEECLRLWKKILIQKHWNFWGTKYVEK